MTHLLGRAVLALAATAAISASSFAGTPVQVDIHGIVIFNGISTPPLGTVTGGQTAHISFMVDSNNFVDGVPGDVRGYVIDPLSFTLSFSGGVVMPLANPFPGTAYFGVVDGFPVSDGFFVSSSPVSPGGVPLAQSPYQAGFNVGYVGSTLSSLDILDAAGTYDFTGLTNFGYSIWSVFPDNVNMGIDFVEMTITVVPSPAVLAMLSPLLLTRRRRFV